MVGRVKVTSFFQKLETKIPLLRELSDGAVWQLGMLVSLAQRSRCRRAVAVLDRGEGSPVAVVLLAHLAVVGGGAGGRALLPLHGGAGDLGYLVTDLPGDVAALLSLHLVAHLDTSQSQLRSGRVSLILSPAWVSVRRPLSESDCRSVVAPSHTSARLLVSARF